jgi:hypothetical protein
LGGSPITTFGRSYQGGNRGFREWIFQLPVPRMASTLADSSAKVKTRTA